jgi:hypothetical protein
VGRGGRVFEGESGRGEVDTFTGVAVCLKKRVGSVTSIPAARLQPAVGLDPNEPGCTEGFAREWSVAGHDGVVVLWHRRELAIAYWILVTPLLVCTLKIIRLVHANSGRGFDVGPPVSQLATAKPLADNSPAAK